MTGRVPQVALVGITGYGRVYLEQIRKMQDEGALNLAAVVAINRSKCEELCLELKREGIPVFENWQDFLAWSTGKIDLCILPVPIHLHEPMTLAALSAGLNVLVEKPLAGSLAQGRRIIDAANASEGWVAVGFQECYADTSLAIRQQLAEGRIGKLESIHILGLWARPESYFNRSAWSGRLEVDGRAVRDSPLNNALAHYVNQAIFWGDIWMEVLDPGCRISGNIWAFHDIESFDTAALHVELPDGLALHAFVSHTGTSVHPARIRLVGTHGQCEWVQHEQVTWTTVSGAAECVPLAPWGAAMRQMLSSVLARASGQPATLYTPEQALVHTALIERIHAELPLDSIPDNDLHISPEGERFRVVPWVESTFLNGYNQGNLASEGEMVVSRQS